MQNAPDIYWVNLAWIIGAAAFLAVIIIDIWWRNNGNHA